MRSRKPNKPSLVVVGNGMAGIACLEQILRHGKQFDVTVFGDETHVNYSRILLSNVLAGVQDFEGITLNPLNWYQENSITLRLGVRVTGIDPLARTVNGDDGSVTKYDKLLLATGSRSMIPPIPGMEKAGVCAWRTLDDTKRLLEWSGPGKHAVVVGGGLLGLEAARGLQVQGCDVTIIHLLDTLMNRQLDNTGGHYLQRKIENLGIHVRTKCTIQAVHGSKHVESVELNTGKLLPADIVVVAAGIIPNVELGRMAGLTVKRGIVVNDYMETSDPDIYAVGECVEHRGMTYGLVAPLIEQGKVLAATITGNRGPVYEGSSTATKLKVAGVDVFSAGTFDEAEAGVDVVRYEDPGLGIYKKLVLREGRMIGAILVGDVTESGQYMEWIRSRQDLTAKRRSLLIPEPKKDPGATVAEMSDAEVVCGCMGVTKGAIIEAIHDRGICTLPQLKEATRASTGCGSCAGTCNALLAAVAPGFEPDKAQVLCGCVPYSEEQLRSMIHTQQIRGVQQVLEIYGNGVGCEKCRPALSYMVDVVWNGGHEEDRASRFINDRVHANIQRDGTFSVIPRMRGGVTSPDELRKIADVADKYNVPLVKVTGSQRIDLLGVNKEDLPGMWADLGMPSGQGYSKGLRMVKTCVGADYCRFGTQEAIGTGIELEKRLENLYTPHKTKLAVVGCPRNCAEATVKDIGLVGQEGSWQVVVGGAAGKSVRKADVLITVATTEEALESAELFFQYYREGGNYLERSYDFVERLGMDKIRRETVYAPPEARAALLERLHKAKAASYDAWQEGAMPRTASQFVQIQSLETPVEV
ncbi:MAG TPA: nitrite reductase large subunit NirB [Paludibaculum sp.]|jgi:nitrite reductase (NADH) large subunit